MRFNGKLALPVVLLWRVCVASAAEHPAQFKAWGPVAGAQAPLPPGWKEVSPQADDLKAPPGGIPPEARRRGYLVFARHPLDLIYPGSFPRAQDRGDQVSISASLDEFEPFTFGVRALRDMKNVTVRMEDLAGPGGARLPSSQFDIRVVRPLRFVVSRERKEYLLQPLILEKRPSVSIPAETTLAFWVTAYVPPDTQPGAYKGTLTIGAQGLKSARMTILLEVLPLRLKTPPQMYLMWGPYEPLNDEAMYQKISQDLWDHGMTASWPAWTGEVGKRDVANKNRRLPKAHLGPMRQGARHRADLWGKTEFAKHPRPSVGAPNLHWVIRNWDTQKGWDVQWPLNEHLDSNVLTLIRMLEEVRKEKRLPEIMYYLYDEAGAHPDAFPFAVHYFRLLKARFPHLKTFTTIGGGLALGVAEIDQLAPVVDVLSTNRISEQIIRDIRDRGREFQVYNGGTMGQGSPVKDRFFFGFYAWKTTATGVGQWVYHFDRINASPFRQNHGYSYPSPEGSVPTIHWEAVREGVDDMRYLVTLWDLILQARDSGQPAARRAAEAALEKTGAIEDKISIPRGQLEHHAKDAARLSPQILDQWRASLAGSIQDLHTALGLGMGTVGEVRFPPRQFAYTVDRGSLKPSDVELIPQGDFEKGLGSWAVQAWNGNGSGGRDTSAAKRGQSSVRMTNGAGADDVVVCVWSQPGLKLKKNLRYRFSAWVKTLDVVVGVKLRVVMPGGGDSLGIAGTSDWREIAYEFSPETGESPKYLAVWLQGPGTAWVDDVSLREVL